MSPTRRNLVFGWWSLLCWLSFGMLLEAMHGFKVGFYLDVDSDARRLQWSLAHAHGTLIALVNLAFAATARAAVGAAAERPLARASWCLRWAGILMPAGFLLGGLFPMGPDPGFGVVLVPVGGVLLFAGVLLAAKAQTGDVAVTTGAGAAAATVSEVTAGKRSKGT
jgi:hypothetical protein